MFFLDAERLEYLEGKQARGERLTGQEVQDLNNLSPRRDWELHQHEVRRSTGTQGGPPEFVKRPGQRAPSPGRKKKGSITDETLSAIYGER